MSRQAAKAREATVGTAAVNRSIAMQIGFQTERTRAEAELQRSLTTTLQQTTATLEVAGRDRPGDHAPSRRAGQLFDILQAHVHDLLDATHFSVWALVRDGDDMLEMVVRHQRRPVDPARPHGYRMEQRGLQRRALRPHAPGDPAPRWRTEGFNPNHMCRAPFRTASALYAPLRVGEQLLGVMSIQSPQANVYGERERLVFRTLCAYGAIGLHNARAYERLEAAMGELHLARDELADKNAQLERAYLLQQEASYTDPLTQLRNRRFLMEHIEHEVALTLRRFDRHHLKAAGDVAPDHDLVFYMLDIDHFKAVNDLHGHPAGDAVLVGVAQRLRDVVRDSDFLVRWGGEEFLLWRAPRTPAKARCWPSGCAPRSRRAHSTSPTASRCR